ncbi:Uncharacterised protein [uncultured archaeon]|nr:Uncharacterised protein [uncultured archaeon]
MLRILEEFFGHARGRKIVAIEFLRLGLKVDSAGKIYAGRIELPPAKIARALDVDRRVVIETAKEIGKNEKLLHVFYRLEPRAFMGNAARELGYDTIEIRADPKKKGIVASVAKILADDGISLRQAISDDPDLFPDPVLTIIIDGRLKKGTTEKLKQLSFAESITFK